MTAPRAVRGLHVLSASRRPALPPRRSVCFGEEQSACRPSLHSPRARPPPLLRLTGCDGDTGHPACDAPPSEVAASGLLAGGGLSSGFRGMERKQKQRGTRPVRSRPVLWKEKPDFDPVPTAHPARAGILGPTLVIKRPSRQAAGCGPEGGGMGTSQRAAWTGRVSAEGRRTAKRGCHSAPGGSRAPRH